MWEVFYDKWLEQWVVKEFTRELFEEKNTYLWREDADRRAAELNRPRTEKPRPTTREGRENYAEYDTQEASDIWPGGAVSYGYSRG